MKNLSMVLVLFCLVFVLSGCFNQEKSTTIGTGEKLYQSAKEVTFPEPTGYVTDVVGLLSPETKVALEKTCKEFALIAQVAVLIVDSTAPLSIEDYSIRLAEKCKVGLENSDNGVILLIAKTDRKLRIEVGRGLEAKLTDAKAGEIVGVITSFFKEGKYDEGVARGVNLILQEVKK
jgi:uncharacterized protein